MKLKRLYIIILSILILITIFMPSFAMAQKITTAPQVVKKGTEGDSVILMQMRLRDLGYFNYKITNHFGSFTEDALKSFQKENGLDDDGVLGDSTERTLYSNSAKRKPVKAVVKPTAKPVYNDTSSIPKSLLKDWFKYVNSRFSRGEKIKVFDVQTGISFYMIRVGGSNHADVEPATKADTAALLKSYGGSWSWDRRPIVVRLDGVYIAASINGYPHGYETVSGNNMNGQVCIHFLNSKTHINNAKCPVHQRVVQKAYDATN